MFVANGSKMADDARDKAPAHHPIMAGRVSTGGDAGVNAEDTTWMCVGSVEWAVRSKPGVAVWKGRHDDAAEAGSAV